MVRTSSFEEDPTGTPILAEPSSSEMAQSAVETNARLNQIENNVRTLLERQESERAERERERAQTEEFETRLSQFGEEAKKNQTIKCIEHQIAVTLGDDVPTVKCREGLQELLVEMHAEGGRKEEEILTAATTLANARAQAIREHGDGSGVLTPIRRSGEGPHPFFDMSCFMEDLYEDVKQQGTGFSYHTLGKRHNGAEFDHIKTIAKKSTKFIDEAIAICDRNALKNGAKNPVTVPFPVNAFANRPEGESSSFAETYVESVVRDAQRREPTFRADLLVPFFRPALVLQMLRVPMPIISNDQTLPRLTGSLRAQYLTEQAEIADGNLTFVSATTRPKRMGTRDDVTWMQLSGANAQMPIVPIITSEMTRACSQLEEFTVFAGDGTGGSPVGILSTTGVNTVAIVGNKPTYSKMLDVEKALQDRDIPDGTAMYVITPGIRKQLSLILRWGNTMGGTNRALYEGSKMPVIPGSRLTGRQGFITEVPAFNTNNLPRTEGAGSNEHNAIFGDWKYVIDFQYSMAFLTIDDISQAARGTTRITINKFNDVFVQLPQAFVSLQWNPEV